MFKASLDTGNKRKQSVYDGCKESVTREYVMSAIDETATHMVGEYGVSEARRVAHEHAIRHGYNTAGYVYWLAVYVAIKA